MAKGIEINRIYFREDIAELWGYDAQAAPAQYSPSSDPAVEKKRSADRMRKWFYRHFTKQGLRTLQVGGRVAIHGQELAEWVLRSSTIGVLRD